MHKITVIAILYNEEKRLEGYFKNIAGVADSVVVVDCGSSDRTVEICKKHGAKVVESKARFFEPNIGRLLNAAPEGWLLVVSADERLSEALKLEMREALEKHGSSTDVFFIKRINYLFDGFSTRSTINAFEWRLFRKGSVTWPKRTPHEVPLVSGRTRRLENVMYHYAYTDTECFVRKMQEYIFVLPSEFTKEKKVAVTSGERDWRIRAFFGSHGFRKHYVYPVFRVFDLLFRHRLVLDGWRGLNYAILNGFYEFVDETVHWERASKAEKKSTLDWSQEYPVE